MTSEQIEQRVDQHRKRGEMIVVCGAKGGIGKTVLSVNLAIALSKSTNTLVSILDGDFQFGDISLAMDLHPTFTIKDVVDTVATMDAEGMASYLIHHSSGVRVMPAPERPEYADLLDAKVINTVCDLLLENHDYLIVDTNVGLQSQSIQLIEKADQVFLLTTLEMTTLKNTKLMLETLELLGLRNKVKVVVNRSTMESVIKANDVSGILEEPAPFFVPNDFQLVSQSLNVGIPFVYNHGKTEIAKSIFRMADQLISRREISLFIPKKPSMLKKIFQKPGQSTNE